MSVPTGIHEGAFKDLSRLTHELWVLMSQNSGFKEIRYGPIHLKRSDLCPCLVCTSVRDWFSRVQGSWLGVHTG